MIKLIWKFYCVQDMLKSMFIFYFDVLSFLGILFWFILCTFLLCFVAKCFIYFLQFNFFMHICEFLLTLIYVIDMLHTLGTFQLISLILFFLVFDLSVFYLCINDLSTFTYALSSHFTWFSALNWFMLWMMSDFTMIVYIHYQELLS